MEDKKTKKLTAALAGQPNTGKSTIFNKLTGSRQHVGNWPGKTVEQKTGDCLYEGQAYRIVDLPGTYSLTANSLEEGIARRFLMEEAPDVIVLTVDASQLERSLYLFCEVRLLAVPVVVALNMMDVANKQGQPIDVPSLQRSLGVPVVPMTAAKGEGFDELSAQLAEAVNSGKETARPDICLDDPVCTEKFNALRFLLSGRIPSPYTEEWTAMKLIEGDEEALDVAAKSLPPDSRDKLNDFLKGIEDGSLLAAKARYDWIARAVSHAGADKDRVRRNKTTGFDKAATHPVWGKLIALGIMLFAFAGAMIAAVPIMLAVQFLVPLLSSGIRELLVDAPVWASSLFSDGLIPGLAVALCMLAYIVGVYFVFGILEDVGYLPRLAFVFDTAMSKMGLHGKSFMPFMMSFGCNIAGVTGTRVIDSWRQRMITLVMVSIVPCLALWAVVSFIGTIFFGAGMPLVVLGLLATMLILMTLTSLLFRKVLLKGEETGLIMELPPYHKPNWKTVLRYVRLQAKAFLKRAVMLIALISVIVWGLSYQPDGNMEKSVLAHIGKIFDPISGLMGLDWKLFIALVTAVVAKEASLFVLAVLYGIGQGPTSITSLLMSGSGGFDNDALSGVLMQSVSPASALGFIFAFFFSIPCIGTVATIYSETKSLKWTAGCSFYYIATSFTAGVCAYHVGLLIF